MKRRAAARGYLAGAVMLAGWCAGWACGRAGRMVDARRYAEAFDRFVDDALDVFGGDDD